MVAMRRPRSPLLLLALGALLLLLPGCYGYVAAPVDRDYGYYEGRDYHRHGRVLDDRYRRYDRYDRYNRDSNRRHDRYDDRRDHDERRDGGWKGDDGHRNDRDYQQSGRDHGKGDDRWRKSGKRDYEDHRGDRRPEPDFRKPGGKKREHANRGKYEGGWQGDGQKTQKQKVHKKRNQEKLREFSNKKPGKQRGDGGGKKQRGGKKDDRCRDGDKKECGGWRG
jgi:hypothetical protein